MTLLRVLHAEMLKMKRTLALKMVVLAPAMVALLILFAGWQTPFSTLGRSAGDKWLVLTAVVLRIWASLMLPLYITLETALVAGLDHSENQWKSLLARPAPRWHFYAAKLVVAAAMTAASTVVLVGCILIDGATLARVQTEAVFTWPAPWAAILRQCAQAGGLIFPALAIQHWASLRWRSFSAAVGAGIVATVAGVVAAVAGNSAGGWIQYFPWALPMLVLSRQPHDLAVVLAAGGAAGLLVTAAGCVEFSRRDVK
jgi:hypothetical protein